MCGGIFENTENLITSITLITDVTYIF